MFTYEEMIEKAQQYFVQEHMFKDKDFIEALTRSDMYNWLDEYEKVKDEVRKKCEQANSEAIKIKHECTEEEYKNLHSKYEPSIVYTVAFMPETKSICIKGRTFPDKSLTPIVMIDNKVYQATTKLEKEFFDVNLYDEFDIGEVNDFVKKLIAIDAFAIDWYLPCSSFPTIDWSSETRKMCVEMIEKFASTFEIIESSDKYLPKIDGIEKDSYKDMLKKLS